MRTYILPLLAALALAACGDDEAQVEPLEQAAGGAEYASPDQLHREPAGQPEQRAEVGPEQRAQAFFQALQSGQPEQAAELVARTPLAVSEEALIESLREWSSESSSQQPIEVLAAHQEGDFAILRARFLPAGASGDNDTVRPVVMFQEDGEWKVVWDLLGLEPEQVAAFDPASAQRLEPLYDWYSKQQLYDVEEAGDGSSS